VIGKRLSKSRQNAGIVHFRHTARNQVGEVVAVAERAALMLVVPEASTV